MAADSPIETVSRRLPIVRIAAMLVIMATLALVYVRVKNQPALVTCENGFHEPEAALVACNEYLESMVVRRDENVSLIYRHRMRAYMNLGDAAAAEKEADLAIAAAPTVDTSWQWKSLLFAQMGDYPRALEAIDGALRLVPDSDYSLGMKVKLLIRMGRDDEVEILIEDTIARYDIGPWAWKSAGYFRLEDGEYQSAAEAFGEAVRSDLNDADSRRMFFETCRLAGGQCPSLYPEQRDSYPVQSCEDAISLWSSRQSRALTRALANSEFGTASELFENGDWSGKIFIQSKYTSAAEDLEDGGSVIFSASYVLNHRVFECVTGGDFVAPDRDAGDQVEALGLRRKYSPEVRSNLLDLAHALPYRNSAIPNWVRNGAIRLRQMIDNL